MSKTVVVGHPSSGFRQVEQMLLTWGMMSPSAAPSESLTPQEITGAICRSLNVPVFSESISAPNNIETGISPGNDWCHLIEAFFAKRGENAVWCWSDPQMVHLLDFWLKSVPDLYFIFVFDHPCYSPIPTTTDVDKACETQGPYSAESNNTANGWFEYNRVLLSFYRIHRNRCLLVEANGVLNLKEQFLSCVNDFLNKGGAQQFGTVSLEDSAQRGIQSTLSTIEVLKYFYANLQIDISRELTLYRELQKEASMALPDDVSARMEPMKILGAMQDIITQARTAEEILTARNESIAQLEDKLGSQARKHIELGAENELLLGQLLSAQEEVESYYSENRHLKNVYCPWLHSAASQIRHSLPYCLGAEILSSSRAVWKLLFLPVILWLVAWHHRRDQKKLPVEMPPLTTYPDYEDALKIKSHLSYKLGIVWLKHIHKPWNFIVLPWALLGAYVQHRSGRKANTASQGSAS
ncbi:MAG: hypothetical protein JXX14_02530 [Deltaproteobacteria bacterium]|nr:hypothetical protein [Deltaproteobacteria bacterium]